METVHFREFLDFVADLGVDAVIELLNSRTFSVAPDFVLFAADLRRVSEADDPTDQFHLSTVRSFRTSSVGQSLEKLRRDLELPRGDRERLNEAVLAALTPEPPAYGDDALQQARKDFISGGSMLKVAVALRLRNLYGLAITPNDFSLSLHDEGRYYRAVTNLATLCRLTDEQVHSVIGMSMAEIAHLNVRVEEMRIYESISGFSDEDLSLFEARLRFLVERQNAAAAEKEFHRVISLLGLPQIPSSKHFDVDRLLKLRNSPECDEFRCWLSETSDWSDQQIIERVKSFRETLGRYYQRTAGKTVRLVVSTGIGMIPGIGPIAGAAIGCLDSFLMDRVLRPSGAISFISSSYPSLARSFWISSRRPAWATTCWCT